MREGEWIVAVEGINHIAIREQLELVQPVNAAPVGTGSDDGMLRRILPDDGGQAGIQGIPLLLAPVEHRLVDDFQDGQFRVKPGKPRGQQSPEPDKGILPGRVKFHGAVFVMNVHHDQQAGAVKPLDGRFQVFGPVLPHVAGGRVMMTRGATHRRMCLSPRRAMNAASASGM